jgi:putative ABC transport system permease protein
MHNLHDAYRALRATPVVAIVAILSLALGIGANTAIFSLVDSLMLRALPVRAPDRLVHVLVSKDNSGWTNPLWEQIRDHQQAAFDGAVAWSMQRFNLASSGPTELVDGMYASGGFFDVLGVPAIVGRTFTPRDDERGGGPDGPVAVISYAFWQRRFGGAGDVIGRSIALERVPFTIIGVAPPLFLGPSVGEAFDIAVPIGTEALIGGRDSILDARSSWWLDVLARLKPGQTVDDAERVFRGMQPILRQATLPADWGSQISFYLKDPFSIVAASTGTSDLRMRYERPLETLMVVVGLVLLIACANIANLLLARAAARQREIAIRTAMGASRSRLLRQLLVESVALSVAGGAIGIVAAVWAVRVINRALPANLLPIPEVTVDATVLLFAAAATLATGVLFGIVPALHAAKADLNATLKQVSRASTGGARAGLRNGLAAAELALATVLLIGAGLLMQSLLNLQRARLGFDPEHVLTFQLALPPAKYPLDGRAPAFYRALLESLQTVPGVLGAGISSGIPFGAGNYTTTPVATAGKSVIPPDTAIPIDWRIVSPGFFRTMAIPLVRGRPFTDADGPAAPRVIIVSEATAQKFWGSDDPLGRALYRVADRKPFTVVGVVGDVRSTTLNQQSPAMYFPSASRIWPLMDVVVRAQGTPEAIVPIVRQKVHELDAELPLATVRAMEDWISTSAAQPRLDAMLLAVFAGVALLIAAVGIYGVIAYSVNQRTREIGLRLALGAPPNGVLRLIVTEGMRVALAGIGTGLVVGLALGRAVDSLVYEVPVRDPVTFGGVAIALAAIALAACTIPARRAARVDPMIALRDE